MFKYQVFFNHFAVVGRSSETQLEVDENLKKRKSSKILEFYVSTIPGPIQTNIFNYHVSLIKSRFFSGSTYSSSWKK